MDLIGITLADLGEAMNVEVWPDNWEAFILFDALDTQWTQGFNGPTGINYQAIPVTLEYLGMTEVDKQDLFARVRVMENEALKVMRKS